MRTLLAAVQETVRTIPYLQWVGVLDSEYALPPRTPQFPFVGIVDNGTTYTSHPNQQDRVQYVVKVVGYHRLFDVEPGATLMGTPTIPNGLGTGLLQVSDDVRALLTDNFLGLEGMYWAHCDRIEPSELLRDQADDSFTVMMLKSIYSYRRYLS